MRLAALLDQQEIKICGKISVQDSHESVKDVKLQHCVETHLITIAKIMGYEEWIYLNLKEYIQLYQKPTEVKKQNKTKKITIMLKYTTCFIMVQGRLPRIFLNELKYFTWLLPLQT